LTHLQFQRPADKAETEEKREKYTNNSIIC